MKILHTADWHIGKKLYKYDLSQDFSLFKNWLTDFIKAQSIDILLVSGDIFDTSNPTIESRKLYYDTLLQLYKTNCKVIITGGNHDSPWILNAPKHLVEILNIFVVGSMPKDIKDCVFKVKNKDESQEIIIAAVPYLRNSDLVKLSSGIFANEVQKSVTQEIKQIFEDILNYCKQNFPKTDIIAMGHLFAAGNIEKSESEREIKIGNTEIFDINIIEQGFSYFALGHIHKPQRVNSKTPSFYSGSPFCLSFSEKNDKKRVLLIDTEKGFEPKSIEIPLFRKLKSIKGDLSSIKHKLKELKEQENTSVLENLIELHLQEDVYSPQIEADFYKLIEDFNIEGYKIVKDFPFFRDRLTSANEIFEDNQKIEDLNPSEIFEKLLDSQNIEDNDKEELKKIFEQILEETL